MKVFPHVSLSYVSFEVTKHDESFPRLHSLRWLMVRYLKIGID